MPRQTMFEVVGPFTFPEQPPPGPGEEPTDSVINIIAPSARPFAAGETPFAGVGKGLAETLVGRAAGYYRERSGLLLRLTRPAKVRRWYLYRFGEPVIGWPHLRSLVERDSPIHVHMDGETGRYLAAWGPVGKDIQPVRVKLDWQDGHSIGGQSDPDFVWHEGTYLAVYTS